MNLDPIFTCAGRFAGIAEALCRAVGRSAGRGLMQAAMALVVVRRIARVRGVLLALEARILAGWVPVAGRPVEVGETVARVRAAAPDRADAVRLPRRFGWLCQLVPSDAAAYAGQLRVVLAEPGMVALLAACPQAVRVVRPICRMLGIAAWDYEPGEAAEGLDVVAALREGRTAPDPRRLPVVEVDFNPALDAVGLGWLRFVSG
jgi:hypothetical protein